MKNLIVGLAILTALFSVNVTAQQNKAADLPKYFYKKLEGTIGEKYPVKMELIREDSALRGYYYYENKKIPIPFTYTSYVDKEDNFLIEEDAGYTEAGEQIITGKINGYFVDDESFEGKWQNQSGNKTLSIKLKEKYSDDCAKVNILNYKRERGNCGNDNCYSFSILYPEVNIENKDVEEQINNTIKKSLLQYYFGDTAKSYSSVEELADSFYAWYKADSLIMRDNDYTLFYVYDMDFTVDYNENNILSVKKTLYQFTGGAHGGTFIEYLNFDLKTGKEITLNDIFKNDYKPALNKLGEIPFRKYYKLKPNEDFEKAGFWFTDNKFSVNDNFGFNPEGVVFQYNQYEVAPYALGAASISIPYKEIKEIIKENGLLNSIIK